MELDWNPLPDEKPEGYVQRVGGWKGANVRMMTILMSRFGLTQGAAKEISFYSRSFWVRFFEEHVNGIYQRGGTRYAAIRFVQRKNVLLKSGSKMFSQEEIDELIDSVGHWTK